MKFALINIFQCVQNCAARLLSGSPILKELQWLPVAKRIEYTMLLLKCKAPPVYLKEFLTPYRPTQTLRSASEGLLVQPKCALKTSVSRAFSCTDPKLSKLWNSLPENLRLCSSLEEFKPNLMTLLFKRVMIFSFLSLPLLFSLFALTVCVNL